MAYPPTLKQLQYLTALHEHGHFGRAASACFVTQSTLSAGIRELETLLAVVLVERTRRIVRFTPLGERVVAKARSVLREADELSELARTASKPLGGELRLGVIPTIAPFLLPRLLPRLRARFPDLKLFLREELSGVACEGLARGSLDVVLLALPYACGEVTTFPLFDDPFFLAFPAGDLPAHIAIDAEMLDPERLMLLEDGHCLKDHALSACGRFEPRGSLGVRGTSLHTLVQMVANRLGQTLLPRLAIDAGILDGAGVEARPLADAPARTIALAWRPRSTRAAEYELLGESLLALLKTDTGQTDQEKRA